MDIFEIKDLIKSDNDKCIICQKGYSLENEVIKLNCSHMFHKECIVRWLIENDNCPLCKEYCFEEPDFGEILFFFRKEFHGNILDLKNLWLREENYDDFLRRVINNDYVENDYIPSNYSLASYDNTEEEGFI